VASASEPFPAGDPREPLRRLFLEGGCEYVSVVARDDRACSACLGIADRGYLPWRLPLLPLGSCTARDGCRCRYEPLITVVE
jgi:hypothetical protein